MADLEFIQPLGLNKPGVYSHVVTARGGKTIYVAGQVALDEQGELVGLGDLGQQTQQVYKNIEMALASAGATFDDVVKITIYVANYKPEYRSTILEARSQFIASENPPTSVLLGVLSLATEDFLIEIDAIAVVD